MSETERSVAPRNGLPEFRPYRYNGTGQDIYRGETGYLADLRQYGAGPHEDESAVMPDRQAALAAVPAPRVPAPASAPLPVTPADRCGWCGYLTTAAGHRVMCDE